MKQIQVELQEWMGSDRSIAEAAWTSSTTLEGKEKRTEDDVKRVVKTLIEQKHASPIESVVLRFWIKMPIQTDRQHMTHRIASHNGMSGRYRTMPNEYFKPNLAIMDIIHKYSNTENTIKKLKEYHKLCQDSNDWYSNLLKESKEGEKSGKISNNEYKRIREFFRGVLPQNNMTERVTVMNLRSFSNYQKLRNSKHAQPEIEHVAQLMLEAVEKANICPIALQVLKDNKWEI